MVRHKNRYMVVEISEVCRRNMASFQLKGSSLYNSILEKVQQLHGDFGAAAIRAGFIAKYFNEYTRTAIIRCRHGAHKFVTSSIPCIREIEKKAVVVTILYIGATIKHCFIFLTNYQQQKFDEYCVTLKSDSEIVALKKYILSFEDVLLQLNKFVHK